MGSPGVNLASFAVRTRTFGTLEQNVRKPWRHVGKWEIRFRSWELRNRVWHASKLYLLNFGCFRNACTRALNLINHMMAFWVVSISWVRQFLKCVEIIYCYEFSRPVYFRFYQVFKKIKNVLHQKIRRKSSGRILGGTIPEKFSLADKSASVK